MSNDRLSTLFSSNNRYWLYLFFLLVVIVPYFYLSFYCHPIGDDFANALEAKNKTLWSAMKRFYLSWNGRYSSNLFLLLNPLSKDNFLGYQLVPIGLLTGTIIGFYVFLKSLFREVFGHLQVVVFSLFLTLLFLHQMPRISGGVYWYSGAVTYQLANILTLFYLAGVVQLFKTNNRSLRQVFAIASALLCVFIVGFNETNMLVLLAFTGVGTIICYQQKKEHFYWFVFLLLMTIIPSLFVVFAPGNFHREAHFADNHNFLKSFSFSVLQVARFSLDWISSVVLAVSSVMYFSMHQKLNDNLSLVRQSFHLKSWQSTSFLFLVIFLAAFPPYWATGILGQHRTVNVAYFFFLILWFINLSVWINHSGWRFQDFGKHKNVIKLILLVSLFSGILFSKNGYDMCMDIFQGKAKNFDVQMNERYDVLKAAKESSDGEVFFKPITDPPKTLFVIDIQEDPTHWINNDYIRYFELDGKKVVRKP